MRIRTIKPEFFLHEALYELEAKTRLPLRVAYAGLWCAADREGRFKWEPRKLGVQILPYDGIDFSRVLDALTTRGFIVRYTSNGGVFGYIPSFPTHQIINNRERESELPEPLPQAECDACPTRAPRDDEDEKISLSGREGKGREQGKEGNKEQARGSRDELIAFAVEIGLQANDGEAMFEHWEANGWRNGSVPVKNWKAGIRTWKLKGYHPSQKLGYQIKGQSAARPAYTDVLPQL